MTYLWNNPLLKNLTQREIEVLQQVFSGCTSKQIARELAISPRTVEVHRANILRKLNVSSTPQLADAVINNIVQLERMLAESESHLKEAQHIARVGSWKWDITSDTHIWSDEMYRIFGYQPHAVQLSFGLFLKSLAVEDLDRVKNAIDRCLSDNLPYDIEYRIRVDENICKDIHAIGILHHDATGKPIGMAGTVQDITERKTLERQIDIARQKTEALYQNAPAGFHSLNQQCELIDINQTELDWLGYEKSQVLGKKFTDFMTPESNKRFQDRFPVYLKDTDSQGIEYALICKGGRIRQVLMHSKALFDEFGYFMEIRAVLFEINVA